MTSPPEAPAPGSRIDRYRIVKRLAGSGAGLVFAAEDERGNRVALKTLREGVDDGERARARFLREARAANDVDHPAIVKVLDSGVLPSGLPYLVLPLLEGNDLAQVLADGGPLPPAEAWQTLRPVAEALACAHAVGIIHRDVKPSNVFLVAGAAVGKAARLLDFGLVHLLDPKDAAEAAKLTHAGQVMGTPAYMSPEQWWGLAPAPAIDQYAFGATLFEVLTGRPPFTPASIAALVQEHLNAPPPSLAAAGAALGEPAEALVKRLLAKDAAARFASMQEVIEAGDFAFGAGAPQRVDASPEPRVEARSPPMAAITAPVSAAITATATIAAPVPADITTPVQAAIAEPSPRPTAAGYLAWHIGALAAGLAVLVAVGYAGPDRRDVYEWLRLGGFVQSATTVWFALAGFALPFSARRQRALTPHAAFALALIPALCGVLGTYPNWRAVEAGLRSGRGLDGFRVFCIGSYEANAARFMGFALASLLCVSLVARPAAAPPLSGSAAASSASRLEVQARTAALFALSALALSAALLGAPSGALVATTAALCLLALVLFPGARRALSTGAEIERAAAALCAVGLSFAVGVTRVEARQAVLWAQQTTRAERVAEIIDARAEMNATLLIGAAAMAGAAIPFALAIARAARTEPLPRPGRATWIAVALVGLAAAFDVSIHERLQSRREELRAELSPQFTTFIHLDPPPADQLDPQRFAPQRATALQIARDAAAINGHAVAKLAALDTESGVLNVTAALHQALAQAAVERGDTEVDLAVMADESVPYKRIVHLLSLARAGGARRVDLLFRRGPKPRIAPGDPQEIAYVVPSDFVAVPATLSESGFTAPGDKSWSEVAPLFLAALPDDGAVIVQVARSSKAP